MNCLPFVETTEIGVDDALLPSEVTPVAATVAAARPIFELEAPYIPQHQSENHALAGNHGQSHTLARNRRRYQKRTGKRQRPQRRARLVGRFGLDSRSGMSVSGTDIGQSDRSRCVRIWRWT